MRAEKRLNQEIAKAKLMVEKTPEGQRLSILKGINDEAKTERSLIYARLSMLGILTSLGAAGFILFTPEAPLISSLVAMAPAAIAAYAGHKIGERRAEKFITEEAAKNRISLE